MAGLSRVLLRSRLTPCVIEPKIWAVESRAFFRTNTRDGELALAAARIARSSPTFSPHLIHHLFSNNAQGWPTHTQLPSKRQMPPVCPLGTGTSAQRTFHHSREREKEAVQRLTCVFRSDYRLLIPLNKCRKQTLYAPWKCEDERHTYEKCQYDE